MTIENRIGQPTDGQVPYSGGLNQPPERPPEAEHRPPANPGPPEGIEVDIVDVAKLEEERRARKRASVLRRYHETKQAVQAGDPDALKRWERWQQINREGQRRWRERHPEGHRANQRAYRRRKKGQAGEGIDTLVDDSGSGE